MHITLTVALTSPQDTTQSRSRAAHLEKLAVDETGLVLGIRGCVEGELHEVLPLRWLNDIPEMQSGVFG